ncbi:MAG: hypothetical protein M1832_003468 [Thelocarpon impressellum]|nr:MAG: hypothetical protein M1832_003468 [Thelocarpon impressellum]
MTPEKPADDSSKLKTFLSILRRFIGVADMASVRFSLPAQLLEPIPNLEYWNYLDRPETFIGIGDPDDALGRMLATLRFWFTKDLKYVKGKPCKPYNSALGEFFRVSRGARRSWKRELSDRVKCVWKVKDDAPPIDLPGVQRSKAREDSDGPVTISYITEQTSHHPPVSAFYVACPEKSITACGFDQLSARFTGTSIRVTSGQHNLGIFVTLQKRDNEQYQLTHPAAHLGGILRGDPLGKLCPRLLTPPGSLSVTVADMCYVTCPKTKLKVILHYVEEGWLGRTQNKVNGVVFRYDPDKDDMIKLKDVPDEDVVARIEGCWQDKLYFVLPGSSVRAPLPASNAHSSPQEKHLLVDLNPLHPVAKIVPPEEEQLPNESRRFWHEVTESIKARQYTRATAVKQELEERQRQKAAARIEKEHEWRPRFFTGVFTPVGRPELTPDGEEALQGLQAGDYKLRPSSITGA